MNKQPISSFSTKTDWHPIYGNTVEILRDNRPFWKEFSGAKSAFSFGARKAKAILACMTNIKCFVDSGGELIKGNAVFTDKATYRLALHQQFMAHGRTICRPYLEISLDERTTIRFGLEKAEALIALETELAAFVKNCDS
jgi:hypothetical protein